MSVLAFILALIAIVCFLLAAFGATVRANLVALGLAVLTTALVVQFVVLSHPIHT